MVDFLLKIRKVNWGLQHAKIKHARSQMGMTDSHIRTLLGRSPSFPLKGKSACSRGLKTNFGMISVLVLTYLCMQFFLSRENHWRRGRFGMRRSKLQAIFGSVVVPNLVV